MWFKIQLKFGLFEQIALGLVVWLVFVSGTHFYLNTDHSDRKTITMGYMPVITNLAAPLLEEASKNTSGIRFKAKKFASFAEMGQALRQSEIDAAFIIAPLSIVLRQQGEKVNVVYIGNRHESTLVARADLNAHKLEDLVGLTVAVPMRFSGHYLSIMELIRDKGLEGKINVVEMNPPDMASALASGALDAYYVGEPFAAKTLQTGKASLIDYVENVWDGFICNLVVVRQDMINSQRDVIQQLVSGAARSGRWAAKHPDQTVQLASKYWGQPEDLVRYAFNTPENRIVYDRFTPKESEIQEIADKMRTNGLIESNDISGLVDDSFAKAVSMDDLTDEIDSILQGIK